MALTSFQSKNRRLEHHSITDYITNYCFVAVQGDIRVRVVPSLSGDVEGTREHGNDDVRIAILGNNVDRYFLEKSEKAQPKRG